MRKWMLPALGLAAVLAFSAGPVFADDCTDKADAMRKKLAEMPETQEVKEKIAGEIIEGLSKCQAGTNDPWMGVDPRVMEG
jgi:hypothetical protein